MVVVALFAMPKAKGLFHRVITQGTTYVVPKPDEKLVKKFDE
jgi:carboxylesterase type B